MDRDSIRLAPMMTRLLPLALLVSAGFATAAERAAIYPFDVKVGGQLARIEGQPEAAIFAKVAKAVGADAEVEVVVDGPAGNVIVNLFAVDENGSPKEGATPKIILADSTKFTLAETMDKSKLAPGRYGMNVVIARMGTSRVLFEISEKPEAAVTAALDQSTPEKVLGAVFEAARSGELAGLAALLPPSGKCDGDVKDVCGVAKAPADKQKEFTEYFAKGKITGKARVDGKKAEVDFLFGPNGTKKETMELVQEGGKWYLAQF